MISKGHQQPQVFITNNKQQQPMDIESKTSEVSRLPNKFTLTEEDCLQANSSFKKERRRWKSLGYRKIHQYHHPAVGAVIVFRLPKKLRTPKSNNEEQHVTP